MGKTLYYAEFQKPNFSVKRMFANMEFFIKVVQYGKMVRCVTASTMGWNPLWRSNLILSSAISQDPRSLQLVQFRLACFPHGLELTQICSKQGKFLKLVRFSNLCFQIFEDVSPDQTSLFFIKSVQINSKPGQKSGKSGLKVPVNFQSWI